MNSFDTFLNEYPDLGGDFEVIHHSQFLRDLIKEDKIKFTNGSFTGKKITFHDPCYLGRYGGEYEAPRDLIRKAMRSSSNLVEMEQSRKDSFCCGAGGGNMWYEMEEPDRMNLSRIRQAKATGAKTVATGCSFCMIMMDDAVKVEGLEGDLEVKDVAELVAESLEA